MSKRCVFFSLYWLLLVLVSSCAVIGQEPILPGAYNTQHYLPLLKDKRVAVLAHPASRIGEQHLVDSLQHLGVNIVKIFSPEHGFRGEIEAGAYIQNGIDQATQLPVVSLYGKHKKPSGTDMADVDVLVYDLQSVGLRFYTYISTLKLMMEACAEQGIPLIVLDRPNPLIQMTDGPVLEPAYTSFVGALPIPIAYGMTDGELALMMNGECWLSDSLRCNLTVVPLRNYSRNSTYMLAVKPSPNLPNYTAIYLYASLCWFEGTPISVGRGTHMPFQVLGYPAYADTNFAFQPKSIKGMSEHPKYENEICYGIDLREYYPTIESVPTKLDLSFLLHYYKSYKKKYPAKPFFTPFFDKLVGTDKLRKQVKSGMFITDIEISWRKGIEVFKAQRKPYLLYR